MLYGAYHQILDDKQMVYVDSERAKWLVADLVEKSQLRRRYIKKFLGRAEAEKLLKRLHRIYEDLEAGQRPPI